MADQLDNYYQILDIEFGADEATIEAAIKASRKRWRQMQGSPDKERARLAEQRMEQLEAASGTLLEPSARAAYDAALNSQLSAPPVAASPTATTDWGERAKQYYNDGDLRNALTAAKKGTDVDSENNLTWLYYVLAATDLKLLDDADFASAELVNRVPDLHTSHDLRGSVLDSMKRYREAEISYRRAASLEPNNAYYLGRAAWAVLDQGRTDEAIAEAKEIAARFLESDYPARVLRAAGDTLRTENRPQEALQLANELLAVNATDKESITLAILSLEDIAKQGDVGTASTAAWGLLNTYPNDPDVRRVVRFVIGEMGIRKLHADALTWARALLQRFPDDQDAKRLFAQRAISEAETKMAQVDGNSHTILNKAQAVYMGQVLQEVEALLLTDTDTLAMVANNREFLTKQTKTRVKLNFWKVLLAIVAVVFVFFIGLPNLPEGIIWVLIGGALGWWFWVVSFPKQYKLSYKAHTPQVRKSGLQK